MTWTRRNVIMVGTAAAMAWAGVVCVADGGDGHYNVACDSFAIAAGSTATSLSASLIVSQDMNSGDEIAVPRLDERPGILYMRDLG